MRPANATGFSARAMARTRHRTHRWFLHGFSDERRSRYAELQVTSHFSFLRGALPARSCSGKRRCSHRGAGVVDRNSLAGSFAPTKPRKQPAFALSWMPSDLTDGMSVLVYPIDRPAYARLCRLLSLGKKRGGKAKCHLDWADIVAYGDGLLAVLIPDEADATCALHLRRLRDVFSDRAYLALTLRRRPNDQLRLHQLATLATQMRVPTVVTNDVLFHVPARRMLQDVVTCVRHGCAIDELGHRRERHADRYLKSPQEMHRHFGRYPEALARTVEIAERCRFTLDELAYQYPKGRVCPQLTPQQAWKSWPGWAPPRVTPKASRTRSAACSIMNWS